MSTVGRNRAGSSSGSRAIPFPATMSPSRAITRLCWKPSSPVRAATLLGGRDFDRAAAQLAAALTLDHRAFLASLKMSHTAGGYFFCHAGVRPGLPLDRQSDEDLLWIRDEFLDSDMDF